MVIFAVFMIIWTRFAILCSLMTPCPNLPIYLFVSSFFLAIWNRRQAFAAMKWGTLGIEEVQQDRPQFQGIPLKSPINGREFAFFDSKTKTSRSRFAMVRISRKSSIFVVNLIPSILVCDSNFDYLRHRSRGWYLHLPLLD
jgi:hypothetical protein